MPLTRIVPELAPNLLRVDGGQNLAPFNQGVGRDNLSLGLLDNYRNKVINGDFAIAQRGIGPFSNSGFTVDRWKLIVGTGSSTSISWQPKADLPYGRSTYINWARPVAGSSFSYFIQPIEGAETLAGKRCTLTFWASASVATEMQSYIFQYFGSGGTTSASSGTATTINSITTVHKKFSIVVDIPSVVGKLYGSNNDDKIEVTFSRASNAPNPTATIYISRVSLVEGDVTAEADPFYARHPTHEYELCQRYYQRLHAIGANDIVMMPASSSGGTAWNEGMVYFPTLMRANPYVYSTTWELRGHHGNAPSIFAFSNRVLFRYSDPSHVRNPGAMLLGLATADAEI